MKLPAAKDYPKFVNVHDEKYEIRMVTRIPGADKDQYGECDDGAKIIHIRKNQSPMGLFRTFLHEVLHAIECEYRLKLKHEQVDSLEVALTALIVDNF